MERDDSILVMAMELEKNIFKKYLREKLSEDFTITFIINQKGERCQEHLPRGSGLEGKILSLILDLPSLRYL